MKVYDKFGVRVTDCCHAHSTYHDEQLVCKVCFQPVSEGEGDGTDLTPERQAYDDYQAEQMGDQVAEAERRNELFFENTDKQDPYFDRR